MGIRFNKRIKLLPYVTANVGKSGVSLTIGPKGKTLNIGSTGVNVNVSMGQGVGYSKRLITWKKLNILGWLGLGGAAATTAAKKTTKKGKKTSTKTATTDATSPISLDDAIAEAESQAQAPAAPEGQTLQEQAGCGPLGCILGAVAAIIILALIAAVVYLFLKLQSQTA